MNVCHGCAAHLLCLMAGFYLQLPYSECEAHHEIELGVVIGKTCSKVSASEAMSYIKGCVQIMMFTQVFSMIMCLTRHMSHGSRPVHSRYCLAIDVTSRHAQNAAKEMGRPWTEAKGFDTFCPIGPFIDAENFKGSPQDQEIYLAVNGEERQRARYRGRHIVESSSVAPHLNISSHNADWILNNLLLFAPSYVILLSLKSTNLMLFDIPNLIHHGSKIMTLYEGDLLLTGTPAGVGELTCGDVITCGIRGQEGSEELTWYVA